MVSSKELIGTGEWLTILTRCRINRCRYNRSQLCVCVCVQGVPNLLIQKSSVITQKVENLQYFDRRCNPKVPESGMPRENRL